IRRFDIVNGRKISRHPEQEEPPDTVRHKLTKGKCPSLLIFKTAGKRHFLFLHRSYAHNIFRLDMVAIAVLHDVFQFAFIDLWMLVGLFIHKDPKAHPYKPKGTNDDKRHLPSPISSNDRDCQRCRQRTDCCSRIKNTGSQGTVFFREEFRCSLDCCRKVSSSPHSQYKTGKNKQCHTDIDNQCHIVYTGYRFFGSLKTNEPFSCHNTGSGNTTKGM